MMKSPSLQPNGTAFIFTFPFLVYVENSSQIKEKQITFNGKPFRIYPFFRSGKANFIPMPPAEIRNIPFIDSLNISASTTANIPLLSAIPDLERTKKGELQMLVNYSEKFERDLSIMPMDSIRIDLLDCNEVKDREITEDCLFQLIQLIRQNTKQWWLGYYTNAGFLRATFSILENGMPLENPYSNARNKTIRGFEIPVSKTLWETILTDLEKAKTIPLYDSLILDAVYFAETADIRRALLDATIACEQARDVHFERLWNQQNRSSVYKTGKVLTNNSLPTHLSFDLEKLTNNQHSYEKEHPNNFALIENLWNVRGNIAHGRPIKYYKNNILHTIDEDKTKEFIKVVEHCIYWLENL